MDSIGLLLQYLLLVAALAFVLFLAYKLLKHKNAVKKPAPTYPYRLMLAIKRRQASISLFLNMNPDEQQAHISQLEAQWQALNARLGERGSFVNGYITTEYGLASGSDQDWSIFAFYDLKDYNAFRECVNALNDPAFINLRNHCDIRLLAGKSVSSLEGMVKRLF